MESLSIIQNKIKYAMLTKKWVYAKSK
jgi:hypothetical protein